MDHTLSSTQIAPFVRFAGFRHGQIGMKNVTVWALDCRMFWFTAGRSRLQVDGVSYEVEAGDLFLLPPLCPYRLLGTEGDYYLVNFDYLATDSSPEHALPVLTSPAAEPHQHVTFTDLPQLSEPIRLRMAGLEAHLSEMAELYAKKGVYFRPQINAHFTLILLRVFSLLRQTAPESRMAQMMAYVADHCAEPLTNRTVGEKFHYHPNYVSRLFLLHTGQPLHRYLVGCRIEKAIRLLQSAGLSVGETAEKTGFKNVSQFSRAIRRATGYPPSSFRIRTEPEEPGSDPSRDRS